VAGRLREAVNARCSTPPWRRSSPARASMAAHLRRIPAGRIRTQRLVTENQWPVYPRSSSARRWYRSRGLPRRAPKLAFPPLPWTTAAARLLHIAIIRAFRAPRPSVRSLGSGELNWSGGWSNSSTHQFETRTGPRPDGRLGAPAGRADANGTVYRPWSVTSSRSPRTARAGEGPRSATTCSREMPRRWARRPRQTRAARRPALPPVTRRDT